jgi:hypothetical protein
MQLAATSSSTVTATLGGSPLGDVKRGMFAKPVSLFSGDHASDHASFDDAIAAAKQLSAGPAPAAIVQENLYSEGGERHVPAERHFSVSGVTFQEFQGERGGVMVNSGPYHHGDFSRTKGYELDAHEYDETHPHEALVLVDDDQTWSNGIAPSA